MVRSGETGTEIARQTPCHIGTLRISWGEMLMWSSVVRSGMRIARENECDIHSRPPRQSLFHPVKSGVDDATGLKMAHRDASDHSGPRLYRPREMTFYGHSGGCIFCFTE